MAKPNPTQQEIIDIANKYGYKVVSCYASQYRNGGKVYHTLVFSPRENISPEVYFDEDTGEVEKSGIDRFKINHSAFGSATIQEEKEFVSKVQSAIQMCVELNEVDLIGLPVLREFDDSVHYPHRAKIQDLFGKV